MNIHEYQAAEIFASHGIPINIGIVCTSPSEVEAAARTLGQPVVIKAQVHSGGRGKAGGVKVAQSPEQARSASEQIFGLDIRGHIVHKVLVAPAVNIQREVYLGVTIDRAARGVTIMASSEGGVDIEEVAATAPEKIQREIADPMLGLHPYQARRLAICARDRTIARLRFCPHRAAALSGLHPIRRLAGRDQPAGDRRRERLAGARLQDGHRQQRLYRHKDFEALRDPEEEVATEVEARASGISFVKLDGTIGCVVNGAGLSMATMDAIKLYGGEAGQFPRCRRRRERRAGGEGAGDRPERLRVCAPS